MTTFAEQLAAALADRDAKRAAYDAAEATYQALLVQAPGDGLDVSEAQGDIDWARTKAAGYTWAFVRCSDGDRNDVRYTQARVAALRSAGMTFGPYYFARIASDANGQRDGRTEAAMAYYFARRQGWGQPGDLPLVYDFEGESYSGQSDKAKIAHHLVEAVHTLHLIQGVPPILYTNPSTMQFIGPGLDDERRSELAACPLWIAHWGVTSPTVPAPWTEWTFWQHSSGGTVAGVNGTVDLDQFAHTRTDLEALLLR